MFILAYFCRHAYLEINTEMLKTMTKKIIPFPLEKTIFLIDGSSFLYRAYHSIRPLHTIEGKPVQAVFGFCRMIKKLVDSFKPHHAVVVWDSKGPTERKEIYPEYKATRQAPPSDLFEQKELILEFNELIGLKQLIMTGVEADDLIASAVQTWRANGYNFVIVTSDKDLYQLLGNDVVILDPFKDEIIDKQQFEQSRGFPVNRLAVYHALIGDASDNIPGVSGIGAKGATEIVSKFSTLDDIYANLHQLKERTRLLLEQGKENAYLSLQLFQLRIHQLPLKPDACQLDVKEWVDAHDFFIKLNFKSLLPADKQAASTENTYPMADENAEFILVNSIEKLLEIANEISKIGSFAFDTETVGLETLNNPMVGISLAWEKGKAYYIPCGHTQGEQLSREQVLQILKPLFESPNIAKYAHNAMFDNLVLLQHGCLVQGITFDTMLAASLLLKDWQGIGLKDLSAKLLQTRMMSFKDIIQQTGAKNFSEVPLELATRYAAADAHQTLLLTELLNKQIEQEGFRQLFYELELPVSRLLFAIVAQGIICDTTVLMAVHAQVSSELADIERMIHESVGKLPGTINLNSPKQIQQLLFTELGLPPQKKSAKKTSYSTDSEVLESLIELHPVVAMLMRYRELYKLESTYILSLPTYVNRNTNKIHTTLSQTSTATGRLSSFDPNLQNIPVERHELAIRSSFVAPQEHVLLSADYSQIELRVLAYLSQDANLLAAFAAGHDIHQETAAKIFQVPLEFVTPEQRQLGKTINFSILYGLTPFGLSQDLGIPLSQAKEYIERYFAQYPAVATWMDNIIVLTKERGYVTTHWGRRRYVPGINEKNQNLFAAAKRVAINTVAQGTAAEIVKWGMLAVDKILREKDLKAVVILQIHDELLLEVPENELSETRQAVKTALETVVDWKPGLVVQLRHGKNWQEVTK